MCPVADHPIIIPAAPDTVIWKYFQEKYFRSLFADEALFFRRVIDFARSDPFEGTKPERDKMNDRRHALRSSNSIEELKVRADSAESVDVYGMRQRVVVNCWKMAATESNHMWHLYSKVSDGSIGVAVKSTVHAMHNALANQPSLIHGSKVRYIDYEQDTFKKQGEYEHGTANVMVPMIHKNIHGFPDENEYRLIHQYTGGGMPDEWWDEYDGCRGCMIKVDLPELITEVVLSPNSSEVDRLQIEELCRSKFVFAPVRHSKQVPA